MPEGWRTGNAEVDSQDTHGWFLGHFMPEGDVRSTDAVEIKWGIHPPGDKRADWTSDDARTAVTILVSGGPFTVQLTTGRAELAKLGDYVVWGPGIDHVWYATDHSVVVTVRWPSQSSQPRTEEGSQVDSLPNR